MTSDNFLKRLLQWSKIDVDIRNIIHNVVYKTILKKGIPNIIDNYSNCIKPFLGYVRLLIFLFDQTT